MADRREPRWQQRQAEPYEDEMPLAEYLLALWRGKWLIVGISLIFGLLAFAVGRMSPPVYEASVKLVLAPSTAGQRNEALFPVALASARQFIESQSLAAQLVKEFRLDAKSAGLSPQAFLGGCLVVEPRDTNTLMVRVRLANRDLPAKVANRIGELASASVQRSNEDEQARARDDLKNQLDQAREHVQVLDGKLQDFRRHTQIEVLRRDVDAELDHHSDATELALEIASERASLAKAEEELAERKPVVGEYPSRAYEEIDQRIAEGRTRLSGLERKRTELLNMAKPAAQRLEKLDLLYSREAELERLTTEYDIARNVYLGIASSYELARTETTSRKPRLDILDAAITPDRPVGPRVLRNTAFAVVGGFILAGFGLVLAVAVGLWGPSGTATGGAQTPRTVSPDSIE